jgi:hypothetical protein
MEFHPQKCSVLTCSRLRKKTSFDYVLKGFTLEQTTSSKYLGVDICSDLSWKIHIDRITKKANGVLGFLKRNLRTANKKTKSNAYFTLVRPHLEYCSAVWNPHTVETTKKVEQIQRRDDQEGRTDPA